MHSLNVSSEKRSAESLAALRISMDAEAVSSPHIVSRAFEIASAYSSGVVAR
jgi:hypothetical protein